MSFSWTRVLLVLLHYPKIPGSRGMPLRSGVAFEKLDGTNLHWEWERNFGWHNFGPRRDSFQLTPEGSAAFSAAHTQLFEAPAVFAETLAAPLEEIFLTHGRYRTAEALQVFTEFLGPRSFAGLHKADDPKRLVLFDVRIEGYGLVGPEDFVADYGHLPIPRVVHRGRATGRFIEDVRAGKYDVEEGVVLKGGDGGDDHWMAKIKTNAYMARLKEAFADDWEKGWE